MQPNFLFYWPHARSAVANPEDLLSAIKLQVISVQMFVCGCLLL